MTAIADREGNTPLARGLILKRRQTLCKHRYTVPYVTTDV